MKRFVISPASLALLTGIVLVASLSLMPAWRRLFGILVWDSLVVPVYAELRLYILWPFWIGLFAMLITAYFMSRSGWWRYGLNRLALELAELVLCVPRLDDVYASARDWMARWYPDYRARVLERLPTALQSGEFRALTPLARRDGLPPNRIYLAALRARLDATAQEWSAITWQVRQSPASGLDTARLECLRDVLNRERARWLRHVGADGDMTRSQIAPHASGALLAVEQCALALNLLRACAVASLAPPAWLDTFVARLSDAVEGHLAHLSILDSASASAALHREIRAFDGAPEHVQSMLDAAEDMLEAAAGSHSPAWSVKLAEQLGILAAERLVAFAFTQEAIQLHYELDRAPQRLEGTPLAPEHVDPGWLRHLFRDSSPADPHWAATLAAPPDGQQRFMVLADAWDLLMVQLLTQFAASGFLEAEEDARDHIAELWREILGFAQIERHYAIALAGGPADGGSVYLLGVPSNA